MQANVFFWLFSMIWGWLPDVARAIIRTYIRHLTMWRHTVMTSFRIHSDMQPRGDQPEAIDAIVRGLRDGMPAQTLLGVTGSGKTFTMAHVI